MNWLKEFWKGFTTPMSSEGTGPSEALHNFTQHAKQTLAMARLEAERFNHNFIGTEHLLLGLTRLSKGTAVAVLVKMGVELELVQREVEKQVGVGPIEKSATDIPYTPRV